MSGDDENETSGSALLGELVDFERLHRLERENEELRASKGFLTSILESAPDFLCRISIDGTMLFLNRLAPGFRMEDVVGTSAYDYTAPEYRRAMRECLEGVVRTGQPGSFPSIGMGPNGEPTHYYTRVAPIFDGSRVAALTFIATDISPLRKAESEVREADERLRLILEATGTGLWNCDVDGDRLVWDEQACRVFGVESDAAPRTCEEYLARYVDARDAARVRESVARFLEAGVFEDMEHRIVRADGSVRWLATKGTMLRDASGRITRMMGILFDVTARRELEEKLQQAQKMEAVGQLAAGVAHNFNNTLAIIVTSLSMAMQRASEQEQQLLNDSQEAALRAAKLVGQLMGFARADTQKERSLADVAHLTLRTVDMCRQTFDRRIEIHCEIAEDLAPLTVDAVALEQALLNLLINARDALDGVADRPPRIDVSVGVLQAYPFDLADGEPRQPCVYLRVHDNGHGMDEATRNHVFEPFFTTKKDGRGTGLGLATVYAMARDHRGTVECDSVVDRGTTFTIVLPFAPPR
jgi:PAS domain S-box-containing protein